MAMTLDQIKQYAANPTTIPGGGSYGEGTAYNIAAMFPVLKAAVQSGQLSLTDYQGLAEPLAKAAQQTVAGISKQGSKQASAVNGAWGQLQAYVDGNGKDLMPFSKQEYAKLPDSVLPTQNDINSGMFDPSQAPLQRLQPATPPTPGNPSNPSGGTQAPQPVSPGTNPVVPQPQFTPTNSIDQAPPTNAAGNNPSTNVAPQTVNSQVNGQPVYTAAPNNPGPNGGLVINGSQASQDAAQIANEGALQAQLATQSQQGITAQRQQYLNDLGGVLNQNTQNQLNAQAPGIYEDLNTRGLLRSSALGNAMATASSQLQANTVNQLAQQGIAGETSDLGNLTNIQNTYDASRNSALQRQFSVEDYNNQLQAGLTLGEQAANLKPSAPSIKDQAEVAVAGGAAQGGADAASKAATSYICLELIKRGFATRMDLDMLHYTVMPAIFMRARAFYHYAMNGKALVAAANKAGIDWKMWAKPFLGDVIGLENPVEAANKYAAAFKALCMECAPHLWDERVMRTSFIDSLVFIPKMIVYPPYLKALKKVIGMRTRFILDIPYEAQ